MTRDPQPAPKKNDALEARREAALRANLRRRKAQATARAENDPEQPLEPGREGS